MSASDRAKPVTVPATLVEVLWQEIKASRDEAEESCRREAQRAERLNRILSRMRGVGMAAHLPTIEEVQEAWREAYGPQEPT